MTISSEVRKAGPFAGNDVADTFPFTFKVFSVSEVLVVRADEFGVESDLVLGTDYTVTLNGNQDTSPGGDVVLSAPLATDETLVVTSKVQQIQSTDLTNQGGFYPAVITQAFDRLTILVQQLEEQLSRSAKLPITRGEDVDSLLADVVLLADNLSTLSTVADDIANVNTVAGISANVTAVAGVSASIPTVAAIDTDVSAVAVIAGSVVAVAAIDTDVSAVAAIDGDVSAVAAAIPDIQAAVADLPSLAAKVSKTGDTMTGPLVVPAGATDDEVPQAQEIGVLAAEQLGLSGAVMYFARNTAPTGWLKANGAAVSRATYAALFAAIGTTFGAGDGSTTFNLPDLRGEFVRGWDDGRGADTARAFGSAQGDDLKAHRHELNVDRDAQAGSATTGAGHLQSASALGRDSGPEAAIQLTTAISETGGAETRPRNIALLACIHI